LQPALDVVDETGFPRSAAAALDLQKQTLVELLELLPGGTMR
jgi:hypothetical protein